MKNIVLYTNVAESADSAIITETGLRGAMSQWHAITAAAILYIQNQVRTQVLLVLSTMAPLHQIDTTSFI